MTRPSKGTIPHQNDAMSSDRIALWITYLNIILYALCYQLQRPVEPFLVQALSEKAGDSADSVNQTYGRLNSFFSTVQTVGSPLVGILLDRVGIRYASALVFLSSAVSYAILAGSTDLTLLFVSKIPTALQHAFLVAQATAATTTRGDDAARAQALGRMTTAYTIGATMGPALGGYLADTLGDLYLGAKLAVVGSLISVVFSLWFLPNAKSRSKTDAAVGQKRSFLQDLKKSGEMAMRRSLWPLLMVKVLGGVSASMQSTAGPLVLTQNIHWDPSQLGFCMSSSMFAVAAFGAIAMAPLARIMGPPGMVRIGLISRALLETVFASIVVSSMSTNDTDSVVRVVTVSVLYALSSHALATGLTTQTTGVVDKTEQGALLGLEHGLFSMARIFAPPMSTYLLSLGSFWYVAGACSLIDVALVGAFL